VIRALLVSRATLVNPEIPVPLVPQGLKAIQELMPLPFPWKPAYLSTKPC
jgi:hypothetical protein